MKKILAALFLAACMTPTPPPDAGTSKVEQEIAGPCKGADGLFVHCHWSSTSDSCRWEPACGVSGGWCQESNGSEYTFCSNIYDCSHADYHTYCNWGPTSITVGGITYQGCQGSLKDPSAFTHNCIAGPQQ